LAPNITTIDRAFNNNQILTSIIIPSSITTIGNNAFRATISLKNVNFTPNSRLTTIENNAFTNSGLTLITLPNTVTTIANNSFVNTISLTNITMQGKLRGNNLVKYGFTQPQWNNINWIYPYS